MHGSLTVKSFQNLLRPWIEECFRIMKSEFQARPVYRNKKDFNRNEKVEILLEFKKKTRAHK